MFAPSARSPFFSDSNVTVAPATRLGEENSGWTKSSALGAHPEKRKHDASKVPARRPDNSFFIIPLRTYSYKMITYREKTRKTFLSVFARPRASVIPVPLRRGARRVTAPSPYKKTASADALGEPERLFNPAGKQVGMLCRSSVILNGEARHPSANSAFPYDVLRLHISLRSTIL